MNFTISTVAKSLADYLAPAFPGVAFYQDPNQQGTAAPCFFLQQTEETLTKETGGYYLRTIGLDLTYLERYNLPNLQQLYQAAAETLDLMLDTFPYTDGEETALVRAYDRNWRIDLDAMHYEFEIRERVRIPEDWPKMQTIQDLNEEVG